MLCYISHEVCLCCPPPLPLPCTCTDTALDPNPTSPPTDTHESESLSPSPCSLITHTWFCTYMYIDHCVCVCGGEGGGGFLLYVGSVDTLNAVKCASVCHGCDSLLCYNEMLMSSLPNNTCSVQKVLNPIHPIAPVWAQRIPIRLWDFIWRV